MTLPTAADELPHDSLFERCPEVMTMTGLAERDRCMGCGEYVMPNSESRTAHLSGGCEAWEAHCRGEKVPELLADSSSPEPSSSATGRAPTATPQTPS